MKGRRNLLQRPFVLSGGVVDAGRESNRDSQIPYRYPLKSIAGVCTFTVKDCEMGTSQLSLTGLVIGNRLRSLPYPTT